MTLNNFIKRLNWLIEDGIDANTEIENMIHSKGVIQIRFGDRSISELYNTPNIWEVNNS